MVGNMPSLHNMDSVGSRARAADVGVDYVREKAPALVSLWHERPEMQELLSIDMEQ
jgi:hypothetical protein